MTEAEIFKKASVCVLQARRRHPNATDAEIETLATELLAEVFAEDAVRAPERARLLGLRTSWVRVLEDSVGVDGPHVAYPHR